MEGSDGCLPWAAHATSLHALPASDGHCKLLIHKILYKQQNTSGDSYANGSRYLNLWYTFFIIINPTAYIALHLMNVQYTFHKNSKRSHKDVIKVNASALKIASYLNCCELTVTNLEVISLLIKSSDLHCPDNTALSCTPFCRTLPLACLTHTMKEKSRRKPDRLDRIAEILFNT